MRRPTRCEIEPPARTPELACSLTASANSDDYPDRSPGLRAVRRGFHVLAVHHPSGDRRTADVAGTVPGHEPMVDDLPIIGYTNDGPASLPSERILQEGRYEGAQSPFYFSHPAPLAPGVEARVVRRARTLFRSKV